MRSLSQLLPQAGRQLPTRRSPETTVSVVFVPAMFAALMDITIVNVALLTLAIESRPM